VFSYTIVHRAFHQAFASWVPYVSALVTLDESSDVRFVTRLVDCNGEISIGMPVVICFTDVGDGLLLPFFKPSSRL
jgi:uncharacterized protein